MNLRLFVVLSCLFVVMTGYGVTLSVLPFHIERMALAEGVASKEASVHVGLITGLFALMQFFFAPVWGKLSDRIGRRPVLGIGMLGFALANVFFGLSSTLFLLYVSRFLGGSLSAAVLPVTAAFVADLTPASQRGKGMAWMGSAAGLGVMVGPALGGWLAEWDFSRTYQLGGFVLNAFSVPFFAAGGLALLALAATAIWVREPSILEADGAGIPLKDMFYGLMAKKSFRTLLCFSFLVQFAMALFEGTFALHATAVMGFGPGEMGLVLMVCGLVMAVAQGGVVSWFIDRLQETRLLFSGFVLMSLSLILLMIPRTMPFVLLLTAIFGIGMALLIPILASMVSRYSNSRAGAILGVQNAVNSLGQAMGPLAGGLLFTLSIHLPYMLTGLMLLSSTVLLKRAIGTTQE
ncbi:MAG: MFS transporter [Desulfohalobiaceae bacterium]|nr:MFS transporter [Desulfohalobiaceae bacterium]